MPLPIVPILSAAATVAGSAMQQSSSRSMSREQMRFQERMSSTAHQREVEDLRKAGLNPLLSVNSGADTPGGAMGEAQNVASNVVSSAQQAAMLNNEMKLVKAQVEKVREEKDTVALDNYRRKIWMGVGLKPGDVPAIGAESGFAAEIASARAMAAGSGLGLSEKEATSKLWEHIGKQGKGVQFILPLLMRLFGGKLN